MSTQITKTAVVGAGSMGSGIAALMASAGFDVVLLDVQREGAQKGVDIQLKRRGFYHPEHADNIQIGSTEEDLHLLEDVDWVVEAIFEDIDAKHELYAKVEPHLSEHAFLTSNTSTLPLAKLKEGIQRPEKFGVTHFFNPPKVMQLIELIAENDDTREVLRTAIDQQLGKTAVDCRDTPGFIANRVGCFWMAAGVQAARDHNLEPELADAAFGRPFGIPRTGIYGLLDFIGLQLVKPIWGSLEGALPKNDRLFDVPLGKDEFIAGLVERGLTGRTGEGGFYRGRGETITADYTYRERIKPEDPALEHKDPRAVMETDSPAGRFARQVFLETLRYCCEVAPEIAEHVGLIDEGLELGFGWKKGIFALADSIGLDWVREAYGNDVPELLGKAQDGFYPDTDKVLNTEGEVVDNPPRAGVVTLAGLLDEGAKTVIKTDAGSLHRLDNGVGIIDLHTPLNSLPTTALAFLREVIDSVEEHNIRALVIGNDEARAFSAGADLPSIAKAAEEGDVDRIRELITDGSQTMRKLRNAPLPIVGAVRSVALGGGGELAMACDRLVAHADAKIGFPERNVGLYPGWNGTVAMLERNYLAGHDDYYQRAFDFIASAKPAPNAFLARDIEALRDEDVILMSAQHVLARAIKEAEMLADDYSPRPNTILPLYKPEAAPSGAALDKDWPLEDTTDNDHAIIKQLVKQYTAEDGIEELTFDEYCDREIDFVVPTLTWPANIERTAHMAATRKPLRN
ncbi:3-hydroxyacyl-CoA dehydrogenase/enoyl-CoA hydratase family protein [Corynebacterium camporealensis]|uniref:3-hydroxyacyl-CoA dehydrogenase/enoyl-CoA hydratase family protein n=1 Tax=Corynebacterium camporealensis TaxID=161896 RepID=UPI0034CFD81C